MPGFLLHVGAQVICSHAGQAQPIVPNPRVTVSGQPTVFMAMPYLVTGCTLPTPPAANGPCLIALWTSGTTRVTSNGLPLLVLSSQSICLLPGTPLKIIATQTRVSAT